MFTAVEIIPLMEIQNKLYKCFQMKEKFQLKFLQSTMI